MCGMRDFDFYQAVKNLNPDAKNMVATCLGGACQGMKALFSDGRGIGWQSPFPSGKGIRWQKGQLDDGAGWEPQVHRLLGDETGWEPRMRGLPEDGTKCGFDAQELPDDGTKCGFDAQELPDDGTKCGFDAQELPDDGTKLGPHILGCAGGKAVRLAEVSKTGIYGSQMDTVFCEMLAGEAEIVICGGGHVSVPVIQIGRMLGCQVTVLEDRAEFAGHARQAGASEVICRPFEQGLETIAGGKNVYFIIVTRGHRYDQICLERIAKKEHAYIGMMGSRKRTAAVKQALIENGADADVINRVYTPIGLEIGARTPEEIAVAVMAQLIQVKNKNPGSGFPQGMLDAILDEKRAAGRKVLATIISRTGSAPREVGTKMLVLADGSCIGTIGGGCAEAKILQKAQHLLEDGVKKFQLCQVDMTGREAEEEGMVCGGAIEVMLEVLGME